MSALREILLAVDSGRNILLHSPGGCGKSYSLKKIAKYLKDEREMNVMCTATTGVASLNLHEKGSGVPCSTFHRWAGIKLGRDPANKLVMKVMHDDIARANWTKTDVLIIDEVSMFGAELFEKIDYIGRRIRRRPNAPLGGLRVIISGDFLQLPPVKDDWVFLTEPWVQLRLQPFIFREPKRYDDLEWFQLLLRVRKARHTPSDIAALRCRVKAYEDFKRTATDSDIKPTILYSKKVDVRQYNDDELNKLTTPAVTYVAKDSFESYNDKARYDYYEKLVDEDIPKAVTLKKGAQVMLRKNMDTEAGLVNGSRGIVINLGPEFVDVKFVNGITQRLTLSAWDIEDKDGMFSRSQIPLLLAWASTIHKAQGSTIDYVVIDLGPSVFAEGQAYVALSRVRSFDGLFISQLYPKCIKADPLAIEYVEEIEREFESVPELEEDSSSEESEETSSEVQEYELVFHDAE